MIEFYQNERLFFSQVNFSTDYVHYYLTGGRNFGTCLYIYANICKVDALTGCDIFFVVFYIKLPTF